MEESSACDLLLEYFRTNQISCVSHRDERTFWIPGADRLYNSSFVVAHVDELTFVAFDSRGSKVGASQTFSGIYSLINLPPEAECKIHKKDWLTDLVLINKVKLGVPDIDESVTITCESDWTPRSLLASDDVRLFLEMMNTLKPLQIIIQNDYLHLVPEFSEKKIISLETNGWVYEKRELDLLLGKGVELLKRIIKKTGK